MELQNKNPSGSAHSDPIPIYKKEWPLEAAIRIVARLFLPFETGGIGANSGHTRARLYFFVCQQSKKI